MLPAHQSLEAGDAAGLQIDDRLIVDVELLALDCPTQARLQGEPFGHAGVPDVLEDLESRLAIRLGAIHREVSSAAGPPVPRLLSGLPHWASAARVRMVALLRARG